MGLESNLYITFLITALISIILKFNKKSIYIDLNIIDSFEEQFL